MNDYQGKRKDQIEFTETTMGEDIESRGGVVRGNV